MVMLEDYGISEEKGYACLNEINKAIGMQIIILYGAMYNTLFIHMEGIF